MPNIQKVLGPLGRVFSPIGFRAEGLGVQDLEFRPQDSRQSCWKFGAPRINVFLFLGAYGSAYPSTWAALQKKLLTHDNYYSCF